MSNFRGAIQRFPSLLASKMTFSISQVRDKSVAITGKQPLVSVCIPTYRDSRFLAHSLKSIVSQTYSNLEILVGDDASPDNTEEIVRSFPDSRIHYLRNPVNLGQFENVNHLVDHCRGKYIAIYHSDDYYDPEIVLKEVTFLESHPEVGAVFALDWRVDDSGQSIGKMKIIPEIRLNAALTFTDIFPLLLRHRNRVFRTPTFMGRSDIIRVAGRFSVDYEIAGDMEMWLRIARLAPVAILNEYLMYYRRGSSQVSSGYERLRTHEDHFFVIMDQYLNLLSPTISITPVVLLEYEFHRRADETVRALNFIRLRQLEKARELLNHPFPWPTLLVFTPDLHLRKLVIVIKRILLKLGLAAPPSRWLLVRLTSAVSSDPNHK